MLLVLLALIGLLVAGLIAVNVAYIRHLDAKDQRHDEQVGRLLQRIQAPQMAVVEHAQAQVSQEEDGMPLTDEQIAAEQEAAAALKRIDEVEREFAGRML